MTTSTNPGTLPDVIDPSRPLEGWDVKDAIAELTAAVGDATWFTQVMEQNERTRQCWWVNKNDTGRKKDRTGYPAQPWNGAADHEVHLTEEILRDRQALPSPPSHAAPCPSSLKMRMTPSAASA